MKKIILNFLLVVLSFTALKGQVKIGSNPNTINPNSLLELESTNRGFLPPRIALNDVNLIAPLSSPVPEGMLIYSDGGLVTDGYYYWNGTKWILLSASAARNNFVLVKSISDLPAAVGGTITLAAGTLYEINGTINVPDKIDLNGCALQGDDASNDKLVYTGSGELFTGSNVGNISYLTLTAPSGKIFNINAGGANKNLILQNCFIVGSNTVGTIKGVGGTVFLATVAYFYNTNGITLENDNNVVLNNTLWDISNYNTYEKFIGTFNIIQILGGDRLASSGNNATAEDISGITSLTSGSIKVVMFVGTGTFINGTFTNNWEVEASGLPTEKDDVASGNIYLSSITANTFSAVNTPVKIAGTTTSASLFRTSSPTNNRLTYTGHKQRRFSVICSLSSVAASNNKNFTFYIVKNGTILPESKQFMKCSSQVDRGSITLTCTVSMAPNDYLEVWVENNSDNSTVTVQSLNLAIK